MNTWILQGETADKKGFKFLNTIRDHNPFVLEAVQIRHFDAPDKLVLRGQVIFKDSAVLFEPFHPKPASLSAANSSLDLYIDGMDETGLLTMTSPPLEQLKFIVVNKGDQTVREFRNMVLIPTDFTRVPSPSYTGNLSRSSEHKIGDQHYHVYDNFISSPTYKGDRVQIGSLSLKADPGEYTFLWKIKCDDGIFPSEQNYGAIGVKVVSIGDLVIQAVHDLHKS